jgi:hypothetical protein
MKSATRSRQPASRFLSEDAHIALLAPGRWRQTADMMVYKEIAANRGEIQKFQIVFRDVGYDSKKMVHGLVGT